MMIVSSPIYRARDRILRSVGSPTRNRHAMCASSGPIPTVEQVQVSQQCQYVWAITVVDSAYVKRVSDISPERSRSGFTKTRQTGPVPQSPCDAVTCV